MKPAGTNNNDEKQKVVFFTEEKQKKVNGDQYDITQGASEKSSGV